VSSIFPDDHSLARGCVSISSPVSAFGVTLVQDHMPRFANGRRRAQLDVALPMFASLRAEKIPVACPQSSVKKSATPSDAVQHFLSS